ncbi:MAG: type II secretion system F family protein [Armatimonadota bacterium]
MPWFKYEAQDKTGRISSGVMMAHDQVEIHRRLVSGGFAVVSVVLAGQSADVNPTVKQDDVSGKSMLTAPHSEMMVFFNELASMLKSGINIYETLAHIAGQTRSKALHEIALHLSTIVQQGGQLSTAMEEYPKAFPVHVRGVIASGELGGFLAIVVGDIALDYEIASKASSRNARFWSIFLWINVIGTLAFIPSGPLIAKGVQAMMHATSLGSVNERIMTVLGPFFHFTLIYSLPAILILMAVYYFARHYFEVPENRYKYYKMLLKVPWVGKSSRERSLASFSRILWRLQSAGVLPIQSWEAAVKAPENLYVAETLAGQTPRIKSGVSFSDALVSTGLFSQDDQRILATAEKAGRMTDSLKQMSSYYEDAAIVSANRAKWLSTRIAIIALIIVTGLVMIISSASYGTFLDSIYSWVTEGT